MVVDLTCLLLRLRKLFGRKRNHDGQVKGDYGFVKFGSMNIGKSSQIGKHGFSSFHNLTWICYHNEDILY